MSSFDLVLASNVLHATADLRATLAHVGSLLGPQGLLVLVEGTKPRRFIDLIFGMLDGWWQFGDHDIRPSHPLVSAETWQGLLRDTGFSEVIAVHPNIDEPLFEQTLLVARAPAIRPAPEESAGRHWLVLSDASGAGRRHW